MRFNRLAAVLALIAGLGVFCAGAMVRAQEAPASPAPSETPFHPALPSPKPAADDPKIHKFAVQQFLAWQNGSVNRALYSDEVNDELTDDMMARATQTLANMGGLQHVAFRGISTSKGAKFYVYHMTCERGAVDMDFALDTDGKVALIFFE